MDINLLLNQLIFQYNIDKHMPKYRQYVKAKELAKDVVKELSEKYNKIILAGRKETDIKWFKSSICKNEVIEFRIDCVDTWKKVEIPEEYLNDRNCFINVSFYEREWIKDYFGEKQVLLYDLYDVFEKNGLFFSGEFYDVYQSRYYHHQTGVQVQDMVFFDMNRVFFQHRREYEEEENNESKRMKLEILIFDLVFAKDFLLLKEYIDIYVKQYDFQFSKEYIDFYHAVEKLLQSIRMKLQSRKQKDCIMIWLDALGYENSEDIKFLNDIQENSISFEKIFTITRHTRATLKTLFAKSRPVEEEAYKMSSIKKSNSKLIRDLEKRNYKFQYYGSMKCLEEHEPLHWYVFYSTMTEIYWDILSDMLLAKQQLFCVLHELVHTHTPFVSMGIKGKNYLSEDSIALYHDVEKECQRMESKEYVDKQLQFWSKILPEHMYKIYMTDHGESILGRYRVFMKIQQRDIIPMQCKKVVSYYDFDEIILQILDENCIKEDELCKGYAIVQDIDFYSKEYILKIVDQKDFSEDGLFGFQGIVTESDMFLRYKHGVEYYQKFINDEEMVTDERLEQLRNMISKKEINIENEDKFRYSRIVWNAYRRCKVRTKATEEKKIKIIKNIFNNIPSDATLAIRGGGMYTLRLLMLLEEELRKKVRYVVDKDRECVAGKMGIKVISLEEMKDYHIDFLLLSSYQYKDVWKEEMITFPDVKVIDMYDIFEKNGIQCDRDFYYLAYEKEDIGVRTNATEEEKIKIIKDFFNDVPSGAVLAIRGGGKHTLRLLMLLEEELRRKVRYIVDTNKGCLAGKMGIEVISPEEIKNYHIDFLLLSSFRYRDVWRKEMVSFQNIKLIDMYDVLEEKGIYCNGDFINLE